MKKGSRRALADAGRNDDWLSLFDFGVIFRRANANMTRDGIALAR